MMKTLTVLCNIVLFGFTCFVLATDGAPTEPPYIVFTLLLMVIPIFTVFAIVRGGAGAGRPSVHVTRNTLDAARKTEVPSSKSSALERVAAVCNVVLLAFVSWALVDQYPHPAEEGVVPFAVLTVLTPILSVVALLVSRPRSDGRGPQITAASERGSEAGVGA